VVVVVVVVVVVAVVVGVEEETNIGAGVDELNPLPSSFSFAVFLVLWPFCRPVLEITWAVRIITELPLVFCGERTSCPPTKVSVSSAKVSSCPHSS